MNSVKILEGLHRQRERTVLCDVWLQAEGKKFPAHKSVLAAASSYFEAMFTGSFKESTDNPVVLCSISHIGLKVVLDVIYTGKLELTLNNVQYVLPTAHLLQMTEIVEQSENFMTKNINLENCLGFLQIAEKYELEKCAGSVDSFLSENFMGISEYPGFVELSKESICRYLSDDALVSNGNEFSVFKCVKKWLSENKVDDVHDVIKHIRFPAMSVETLMDEILKDPVIDNNTACRNLVLEALRYHTNIHVQPLQEGPQYRPRGEISLLLISPGRRTDNLLWSVEDTPTEVHLAHFPAVDRARTSYIDTPFVLESLCAVPFGNFLFLFGVDNRSFATVSLRYDASRHQWISISNVPREAAVGCAAAVLDKQIVLIGGMTVNKKSPFKIVSSHLQRSGFIYSIEENTWRQISDLPEALAYMGCTSWNNSAYSAGGIVPDSSHLIPNEGQNSNFVHGYDVVSNTWKRLTPMWNDRSHFCFEAHDNMLYAIGGLQVKTRHKSASAIPNIEMYNIAEDQWTIIWTLQQISATAATSHVIGGRIYILGGERPAVEGISSKKISYFDTQEKKMATLSNHELPKHCSRHATGILTIPKVKL